MWNISKSAGSEMKSLLLLVEKKLLSYRYEYFLECIALNYTNELYLLLIIGNVELALISNILWDSAVIILILRQLTNEFYGRGEHETHLNVGTEKAANCLLTMLCSCCTIDIIWSRHWLCFITVTKLNCSSHFAVVCSSYVIGPV